VGSPTLAAMTECPAAADAPEAEAPAPRRPALSPSRAADFKQCPLLYRFRAIDRLPEVPGRAQVRGTLVHAVLERLYDLPPADRHPEAARALVGPEWSRLQEDAPELVGALFAGPEDPELAEWLASAGPLLDTYFRLEDPRRLEPAARELLVETELPSGLLLRGYVDRLDVATTGQVRIVDYKTGAAPRPVAEARALFQMKFYALVLLQLRGAVPAQLRLLYLTDGESLTYEPDEAQLLRFARTLEAIWAAILAAAEDGDFQPNPGRFCEWCSHKPLCPAWGGVPPAYPGWPGAPAEETPADRAG
jgi:putative RecB family exonuclease